VVPNALHSNLINLAYFGMICWKWLAFFTQICICNEQTLLQHPSFSENINYNARTNYECMCTQQWRTDWVKVLGPIQHKIGHFGDILPSQSLGIVLNKLNLTQKSNNTRTKQSKLNQKNTQNATPKQTHKNKSKPTVIGNIFRMSYTSQCLNSQLRSSKQEIKCCHVTAIKTTYH